MNVSRSSSGLENYVKCVLHRWSTALALAVALAGGLHNPCSDSQWGEGIISIQDGIRIESSWTSASGSSCPIQIQLRTHTHTHGGGASGSGIWGAIIESHSKWQATQGAHCVFFFLSFCLLIRRVSPTLHPRYWRTCIGPTGCQHAPHDALLASCRTAASAYSSHRPMWAPMRRWPCTVIRSDPGCLHEPRRRITCRHLRRVHRRRRTR